MFAYCYYCTRLSLHVCVWLLSLILKSWGGCHQKTGGMLVPPRARGLHKSLRFGRPHCFIHQAFVRVFVWLRGGKELTISWHSVRVYSDCHYCTFSNCKFWPTFGWRAKEAGTPSSISDAFIAGWTWVYTPLLLALATICPIDNGRSRYKPHAGFIRVLWGLYVDLD